MFFEFIAIISLGLAAAGLTLGLQKLTRGRLPKWVMPAAAGLAMLSYTIWSEYSWHPRTALALGPQATVTSTVEASQWYRPWTYVFPVTTRFIAVDGSQKQRLNDHIILVDVYLLARWKQGAQVPAAFNCRDSKRADFLYGLDGDPLPQIADDDWIDLSNDDPMLKAACALLAS